MFFMLRCAFWLSLVAVALPWIADQKTSERRAYAGRPPALVVALTKPGRPEPTTVATLAPEGVDCMTKVGACGDRTEKVDLIAAALESTGSMPPENGQRQRAGAAPLRRATSKQRSAKIDPIAAELQKFAKRE